MSSGSTSGPRAPARGSSTSRAARSRRPRRRTRSPTRGRAGPSRTRTSGGPRSWRPSARRWRRPAPTPTASPGCPSTRPRARSSRSTARAATLRPAIMWMDVRASDQARRIGESSDPARKYNAGGKGPVSAEWLPSKLLWLKEKEHETYEGAAHLVDAPDWATFRLTGRLTANLNTAATRGFHDGDAGGWPTSFYEEIGLERRLREAAARRRRARRAGRGPERRGRRGARAEARDAGRPGRRRRVGRPDRPQRRDARAGWR